MLSRRGSVVEEDFESQISQESGRLEIVLATWLGDLRQLVELGTLRARPLLVSKRPADSSSQAVHADVLDPDSQRVMVRLRPTRSEFLDALGWAPQPDLASIRVPPGYAHAVLEALQRGAVTPSRAVELMRGQVSLADLPGDEADDEP